MRVAGLKRVRTVGRWLKSRFTRGAVILGYHRIANVAVDPYSVSVTPQHFAEQMAVLRQHANPISLQQLVLSMAEDNVPPRAVVLTFDDGYVDFLYKAKPLLERYEIPATLFAVSGLLGHWFWWDELANIIHSAPRLPSSLRLQIRGRCHTWDEDQLASAARGGCLMQLYRLLRPLAEEERSELLLHLSDWAAKRPQPAPADRVLTANELSSLAACPVVEIGGHSATHPVLGDLPTASQRREVQDCKHRLEDVIGRPVASFAYPNGSWSVDSPGLLKESGFTSACTSVSDVAYTETNPFLLPRFWVKDSNGDVFERWLRAWLAR